jgi:tRNA dimethylallyltransferase
LPDLLAIFGPTASGKTGVAIELADRLRERGEDPVAVGCDAIQVYDGLAVLSGAPTAKERERPEHRLVGIAEVTEEFSAGRFAEIAQAEIDGLLAEGRRPIVVGGTGLYLRAALSEIELRPPVPAAIREEVERELAERGAESLHTELPEDQRSWIHPNDRKRIARATELARAGIDPAPPDEQGGELWTARLRRPTLLAGLSMGRDELDARIGARVEAMAEAGAGQEAEAAVEAGASRTARAALGFDEFLDGDLDAVRTAHRRYARRQLTWMRKMDGVTVIDRTGRDDGAVADDLLALL